MARTERRDLVDVVRAADEAGQPGPQVAPGPRPARRAGAMLAAQHGQVELRSTRPGSTPSSSASRRRSCWKTASAAARAAGADRARIAGPRSVPQRVGGDQLPPAPPGTRLDRAAAGEPRSARRPRSVAAPPNGATKGPANRALPASLSGVPRQSARAVVRSTDRAPVASPDRSRSRRAGPARTNVAASMSAAVRTSR